MAEQHIIFLTRWGHLMNGILFFTLQHKCSILYPTSRQWCMFVNRNIKYDASYFLADDIRIGVAVRKKIKLDSTIWQAKRGNLWQNIWKLSSGIFSCISLVWLPDVQQLVQFEWCPPCLGPGRSHEKRPFLPDSGPSGRPPSLKERASVRWFIIKTPGDVSVPAWHLVSL